MAGQHRQSAPRGRPGYCGRAFVVGYDTGVGDRFCIGFVVIRQLRVVQWNVVRKARGALVDFVECRSLGSKNGAHLLHHFPVLDESMLERRQLRCDALTLPSRDSATRKNNKMLQLWE